MSKRNTVITLLAFLLLVFVVIQTGLTADDRIFYGIIGLFLLTKFAWLAYYLRLHRRKDLARNLARLFPDD